MNVNNNSGSWSRVKQFVGDNKGKIALGVGVGAVVTAPIGVGVAIAGAGIIAGGMYLGHKIYQRLDMKPRFLGMVHAMRGKSTPSRNIPISTRKVSVRAESKKVSNESMYQNPEMSSIDQKEQINSNFIESQFKDVDTRMRKILNATSQPKANTASQKPNVSNTERNEQINSELGSVSGMPKTTYQSQASTTSQRPNMSRADRNEEINNNFIKSQFKDDKLDSRMRRILNANSQPKANTRSATRRLNTTDNQMGSQE